MSTRTQVRPYLSPGFAREFCIANIGVPHQQPLPFEISALAVASFPPAAVLPLRDVASKRHGLANVATLLNGTKSRHIPELFAVCFLLLSH